MKVKDLIKILAKADGELEVKGTWEGADAEIDTVYIRDGVVYIDVDEGFYVRHYAKKVEILYMREDDEDI